MKGLLLKDLYNLMQMGKIGLLVSVLWVVIGISQQDSNYISGLLMMLVIMLPYNAMAYDEAAKWDRYALTMPVTRRDLVLSKYLLTLLSALAPALLVFICSLIIDHTLSYALSLTATLVAIGISMACFSLPFAFRFGAQKARLAFFAVILMYVLLASSVDNITMNIGFSRLLTNPWLLLVGMLVITFVSFLISVRIYEKKEL